jgi:predicted HAD superfamily phosphohydrolase YqeG
MLRRARLIEVPWELSVIDLLPRLSGFDVVVVDVDNTLVPDSAPASMLANRLEELRAESKRWRIGRTLVVSNGSRSRAIGSDGVIWQINKPWTRAARLNISKNETVAVIGDRLLLDGLLAWRWGAHFYLVTQRADRTTRATGAADRLTALARRWLFDEQSLA